MNVRGARAVVTGASRGLGAAIVTRLAERGARTALVARDEDALESLRTRIGGDAYPADLCDTGAIGDLVHRITSDGPIDILVNNAGIDLTGDLTEIEPAAIERLFALNLVAPVLMSRAVIPGMRARGRGHIVNVSSLSAASVLPGIVPYSVSKAGLSHFTAGLRAELKGTPIGTTLVEIGPVRGSMVESLRSHPPTRRALRRFERLHLVRDLHVDTVVEATVDAVERDRRHVRLPRRALMFPLLVEGPRRLTELILAGVRAHPGEP